MKALGIIRKMDELGRIVLPMEIRRANNWETNQPMEMFADNEGGLYIKAYGQDAEKKDVLEQLEDLKKHTDNPAVFEIATKAISFINERR